MGEEEARIEVSDVVATGTKVGGVVANRIEVGDTVTNGSNSPEKVEKDGIKNEDQPDVKSIVEDSNGEEKLDTKEEVDEDKVYEDKEEAEKENKPEEKEEEGHEEAKIITIEEVKVSDEVEQEEDKKDEKVDLSEEKMGGVESKEGIEELKEKQEGNGSKKRKRGKSHVEISEDKVENKEEAEKENKPKEKEGNQEAKTEAIEEEKVSNEVEQEESKKDEKVDSSEEKMGDVEECKEGIEDLKEKQEGKGSKKPKREKNHLDISEDKAEEKEHEPKTPTVTNRPVRERKSVERLVAVIEKDMFKEFQVEKGHGTRLKDIPNVAYKLSRKKSEDTFKFLHTILFGRRGKAGEVKNNISRFSGFVWRDNEEKQRMKVKEKFDKCVKEKLCEICDVLDIPIAKSTTKKDDIVAKLLDFLVAPHATTTVLLDEKEQSIKGKKRVREISASRSWGTSTKRSVKSRKKSNDFQKEIKKSTSDTEHESEEKEKDDDEEENDILEKSEDEKSENSESKEKDDASHEEDTIKAKRGSKKNSSQKDSAGKGKTKEITTPKKSGSKQKGTPKRSSSKVEKVIDDADTTPKVFSRKKKNDGGDGEKDPSPKSSAFKEKPGKRAVKGKEKPKDDKTKPTDDELRSAISEMLREVDFNTATFKDIQKKLSKKFSKDLTSRKAAIKLVLQEELTKLADEAEEEGGVGDVGTEKEDAKAADAEQGVTA